MRENGEISIQSPKPQTNERYPRVGRSKLFVNSDGKIEGELFINMEHVDLNAIRNGQFLNIWIRPNQLETRNKYTHIVYQMVGERRSV